MVRRKRGNEERWDEKVESKNQKYKIPKPQTNIKSQEKKRENETKGNKTQKKKEIAKRERVCV